VPPVFSPKSYQTYNTLVIDVADISEIKEAREEEEGEDENSHMNSILDPVRPNSCRSWVSSTRASNNRSR
jgi:hypothetical protein